MGATSEPVSKFQSMSKDEQSKRAFATRAVAELARRFRDELSRVDMNATTLEAFHESLSHVFENAHDIHILFNEAILEGEWPLAEIVHEATAVEQAPTDDAKRMTGAERNDSDEIAST